MKWNDPSPSLLPSADRHPPGPAPGIRDRQDRHRAGCTASILLLTGGLLLAGTTAALESDQRQPIYMEADGVEINDGGTSTYQGDVVVTQGSIRMTADKVTVSRKANGADHVVARGNPVTFQQQMEDREGLIKGRSKRAEYTTDSEIIILIGDAVLTQGKDTFKSDRIIYNRIKGQVLAGDKAQGKRVRVTIQPRQADPQDRK